MNKNIDVISKLYSLIRVDKPDPEPTGHIIPDWQNHINLWKMGQIVDLTPLSNDPHLFFVIIGGKIHSLPILKYDASSDPIRLAKYPIKIGIKDDGLVFSVTGTNANLEMLSNTNPDDVPTIQLIKFF